MDAKQTVILVVDDDRNTLDIIEYNLSLAGYEVITAGDGAQAIEQIKAREDIHAVISDIHMPNCDGFGLAVYVTALYPRPLFFFMTASEEINEIDALNAGADGLFLKPFDGSRLTVKLALLAKINRPRPTGS